MEAQTPELSERDLRRIEHVVLMFSRIYLGGIPPMITEDSAFLSFVAVLAGVEALAGYRHAKMAGVGQRFRHFVAEYFPEVYRQYAAELWKLRNGMVHAFNTGVFRLTHHHSECRLKSERGHVTLNAEDFYGALLWGSQRYFERLRNDPILQSLMLSRLSSRDGAGVTIERIEPSSLKGS